MVEVVEVGVGATVASQARAVEPEKAVGVTRCWEEGMVNANVAMVEGGWTVLARISTSRLKASCENRKLGIGAVRRWKRETRTLVTDRKSVV